VTIRLRAGRVAAVLLTLVALTSMCSCSSSVARFPSWLALKVGTRARLDYSSEYDPEHANLYRTAAAARSSVTGANAGGDVRQVDSEGIVSIEEIDAHAVDGKHVVAIRSDTFSGWVIAEDGLLPVPPIDAELIVPKQVDHIAQELYWAQEDDDDADGAQFGATSRVAYEGFESSPGNPEYKVRVLEGPLAGNTGYVLPGELQVPEIHSFRLAGP
jgi:hypothetical protein